jgi:uncharacterized damage-inducible protein DinB
MASIEPSIEPLIELSTERLIEPWLRGSQTDVPAVGRAVLHALQLAEEDLRKWCSDLSDEQLSTRPAGAPSIAFHIRHLARSVDRLLTYAEKRELSDEQMALLRAETSQGSTKKELFAELRTALNDAAIRVRTLATLNLEEPRTVGKKRLPTTLGGLLVHVADHTQRHAGQAITTAKVVAGLDANSRTDKAV